MLAIGILAVGLAMSMSVFPAAVKQNETSFGNVLGSLIAENGMTVAELTLSPAGTMTDMTSSLDEYVTCYPHCLDENGDPATPTANNTRGRLRVLGSSKHLVVLAYRGHANPTGVDDSLNGSAETTEAKFTRTSGPTPLEVGAYIVNKSSGSYAKITSKTDDNVYQLDRQLSDTATDWFYAKDVIAVRSMAISN